MGAPEKTKRRLLMLSVLAVLAVAGGPEARSQGLVTDLSERLISIYPSFSGAEILVFGTVETPLGSAAQSGGNGFSWGATAGRDIVIVVRGPEEPVVVRRKSRFAGIWINTDAVVFDGVPGYYAVISTRPLKVIASPVALKRHAIGVDYLGLRPADFPPPAASPSPGGAPAAPGATPATREAGNPESWSRAIVRSNRERGLYSEKFGSITLLGNTLFHATLTLPANVPVGNYVTEVYLLRNGVVVDAQISPLYVSKAGFERTIFRLAHQWPLVYGIGAVIVALIAGWLASTVFRRP